VAVHISLLRLSPRHDSHAKQRLPNSLYSTKLLVTLIGCAIVCCPFLSGYSQIESFPTSLGPPKRIDLRPVGFQQFSDMARRSGAVNLSLDFLDRDHILFTFNSKKLVSRYAECPPTHNDRIVHAAILEVSSGKVLSQADWYLHDSRRYIWRLGSGRILLRRLNDLFVVDSELKEKPLWTSPRELLWVSVTPDGKQIITESLDDVPPQPGGSKTKQGSKSTALIEFRDADSMAVQRSIRSEKSANIEGLSSGVASVVPGFTGKVWLVRFGPDERQRANIARVRTRRIPDVLYLSANTLLIGRDSSSVPGYSVTAFTATGNRLWRQHWDAHRYDPILARSENGNRFAISTLILGSPGALSKNVDAEQHEGLEQKIEVFDTATGTHVFSAADSPVVLNGQNFALSPDGLHIALLNESQIEVNDLPVFSTEEEAKYSAVKADVPGLYIPPADRDVETNGPVFTTTVAPPESAETESRPPPSSGSAQTIAGAMAELAPHEQPSEPSKAFGSNVAAEPMLTLRTSSQVVALDVVVTDSRGRTVKNLSRRDFQVREDGKPQTISYFDEVQSHAVSEAATQHREVLPNVFTNEFPSHGSESMTLILYDLLNTPADQQQRSKEELLKFLQNKPKESRFALCALSESLQMVQGFTADESLLVRAAKTQKGSLRYSSTQTQDALDQQTISWLTQGSAKLGARDGRFGQMARGMLDMAGRMEQEESMRRGRDLNTRAWLTVDAFTQVARYLSAIPGRKSLIWLSGSFPLGIFPGVDLRNSDSTSTSYTDQVKQAVNLLAESHIAVYPVDVRGLTAYSMTTATFSNALDSTQPSATSQSPYAPSSETMRLDELGNLSGPGDIGSNLPGGDSPFMQEVMDHGIMDRIAADTGGKAFYNSNGIEQAMSVAMEQQRNYYALSYTPTNRKYDGKFRRIKVSLANGDKKVHAIHRSGYYAINPESVGVRDAAQGFGLAAMQHGAPQAHQIVFEARIAPIGKPRKVDPKADGLFPAAVPGKRRKRPEVRAEEPVEVQRYVVDYAITPSQLRFDGTPDTVRHGVTNFIATSFNDDGTQRSSIISRAVSNLKPESFQEVRSGGLRFRQQFVVPVQASFMRLGVQDGLTGRMGTLEIPLPVKALPGVEQSLSRRMPEIEPD